MILGVTGPIASGKTTLSHLCKQEKCYRNQHKEIHLISPEICEVDDLVSELYDRNNTRSQLQCIFPEISQCTSGGEALRQYMRKIITKNPYKLQLLEEVVHPRMKTLLQKKVSESIAAPYDLIVVCALPKTFTLQSFCDDIITLHISQDVAWQRVRQRKNNISQSFFDYLWKKQQEEYVITS